MSTFKTYCFWGSLHTQLITAEWFTDTGKLNSFNPECGLLWWIEYENVNAIIDVAQLDTLKKIGLDNDILKKIEAIKGTYSWKEYSSIVNQKIIGTTPDWNSRIVPLLVSKGLTLSRKEYSNIIGYSTRGFLGNFMVVYPNKNLVVLRMISWDSFTKGEGKKDGSGYNTFNNFLELTKKLIK